MLDSEDSSAGDGDDNCSLQDCNADDVAVDIVPSIVQYKRK